MSFGKKILEKYGYKDGAGLGKNEDGITDAIKAKFKFDQKGFGSGELREETNHWWERTFNEASNNISVNSDQGKAIKIDIKDKEGVEITNKSYSLKKLKESNKTLQYGNFLKAATLDGKEKEITGHVKTEDIEIKPIQVLTDEELLKACEYRTAHKGARHGLRLSGKLQRIAEQEKALLERMKNQSKSEVFKAPPATATVAKAGKKRPLAELNSSRDDDDTSEDELPINLERETSGVNKKQKKRQKKELSALAGQIESIELDRSGGGDTITEEKKVVHVATPVRKSKSASRVKGEKKLVKIKETEEKEEDGSESVEDIQRKKKKKRKGGKKRTLEGSDDEVMEEPAIVTEFVEDHTVKPKRLKFNDSDEDAIDKINELHHQKLKNGRTKNSLDLLNIDSSAPKKIKRKKDRKELRNVSDDNWSVKSRKKLEKYEKKKLKYDLLQQKLKEKEARAENKSKKKRRKEAKKKIETVTDIFDAVVGL